MCGIAGLWSMSGSAKTLRADCAAMLDRIAHRGPDGDGLWHDSETGSPVLGHRRLSIFDLSAAGTQPMQAATERHWITFNGEIYNFVELRADLTARNITLRSGTDTEVLLEMLARDGIAATLPRLEGMFAFAFWDSTTRCLSMARDAFGKKPLLYALTPNCLRFASELGAFFTPNRTGDQRIDERAARLMMAFGQVPEPFTMLDGVQKLPAGHVLHVRMHESGQLHGMTDCWIDTKAHPAPLAGDPMAIFEERFAKAVTHRLAADVNVGAFLSGGIDSSLVTAQAQALLDEPLRTFTVAFDDDAFDESGYAEIVARHLGTQHHVLHLSGEELESSLHQAAGWSDEPFADTSAIPLRLLSAYAREHVTVALTGDGGDETGLGYPLHTRNTWMVSLLQSMPRSARQALAKALPGQRARWWRAALRTPDAGAFYMSQRMGDFIPPSDLLAQIKTRLPQAEGRRSDAEWLGDCDMQMYLVDDMLTKVDRFGMSVGLELRSPLLDQGVVGLLRSLPLRDKVGGGTGKLFLRKALAARLPREAFERRKTGFRSPIGQWLLRPNLRDWSREHAERFDSRFGWRTADGLTARELWQANSERPLRHGRALWRVCVLMNWMNKHAL